MSCQQRISGLDYLNRDLDISKHLQEPSSGFLIYPKYVHFVSPVDNSEYNGINIVFNV